jgi:hypothetical protein
MNPHELHDDDKPVGPLLTRREMLALPGKAVLAVVSLLFTLN